MFQSGLKHSRSGFMIYYAIVMTLVIVLFILAAARVIDTNRLYLIYNDSVWTSNERYKNEASMVFKIDKTLNSNGSAQDTLSCSGGVISCKDGSDPTCTTAFVPGSDGIADSCNDDNYQGSYSTGNVSNLLSVDSKPGDDDDLSRRRSVGFVPPMSTKEVFAMNSDIKQAIFFNKNNTGPAVLPSSVNSIALDGNFSATGMSMTIYQLDKTAYDSTKTISLIHTFSGSVVSLSGTLMSDSTFNQTGTPFALNIGSSDYVIMLSNQTNSLISYDIGATGLGQTVYIVPLNDSVTPKTLLVPDYGYYNGEFIYRSQVMKE